jgi:hypothetical protein
MPRDGELLDRLTTDPILKTPAKPDVFSLAGLIAWLETQDPTTEYCWIDAHHCLYGQYCRAHGHEYVDVYERFSEQIIPTGEISFPHPRTFGAALSRARAISKRMAEVETQDV